MEMALACVAFSPDGKSIVSGSRDGQLRLWNSATGEEMAQLAGHRRARPGAGAPAMGVAFTPDGRRIVSGAGDTFVRIWDASTGQEIKTLRGHTQQITGVAVGKDLIVSSSMDGTLKVHRID